MCIRKYFQMILLYCALTKSDANFYKDCFINFSSVGFLLESGMLIIGWTILNFVSSITTSHLGNSMSNQHSQKHHHLQNGSYLVWWLDTVKKNFCEIFLFFGQAVSEIWVIELWPKWSKSWWSSNGQMLVSQLLWYLEGWF